MTQWTPFVITNIFYNGLMAMEPQTGNIKAWVGGIDYKYFQYDHVGQGARQVGSTFKPFVYATAIEQLNMSPCDSIIDAPFNAGWAPPRY
jgi:penicillin-binding protein 1A